MKRLFSILLVMAVLVPMAARTKTTRRNLSAAAETNIVTEDSLPTGDDKYTVKASPVVIKGYSKRASDNEEAFFVTNITDGHIGHITLTLLYTDVKGAMLHKRTVTVDCNISKGETRLVKVRSFDRQHRFYYYAGAKPRKSATPYKVKVHVENYELVMKIE